MYNFPSKEIVDKLKEDYPEGTRISLISMDDPYSKLVSGDRGTVQSVDDAGTVHVKWDNGSGLGLAYGEDSYRKLTEKELAKEQAATEKSTITVLVVEPMKEPYTKEIDSGYKAMQEEVGGIIQVTYPYEDLVGIVCNDEGKINHLPLNRAIYDENGTMIDIIAGNFLVVGLGDENFTSLDVDLVKKFSDKFRNPEQFIKLGNEIFAVPVKPSIKGQLKDDKAKQPDIKPPAKNKNNDLEV